MEEANITIKVKEYESLKEKIKDLENEVARLDKVVEKQNAKNETLSDIVDEILDTTFMERLFSWKLIKNDIKDQLK